MRRIYKAIFFAMSMATLFAGCEKQYSYTPPKTEAGLQCVSLCQERKDVCRNNEMMRAADEQKRCERESETDYAACTAQAEAEYAACRDSAAADYHACLKYSDDRSKCHEKRCKQEQCHLKSCYKTPNYGECNSEFTLCFQQCGGTVEERE